MRGNSTNTRLSYWATPFRLRRNVFALGAVSALMVLSTPFTSAVAQAAPSNCDAYQVRSHHRGSFSSFTKVELSSGGVTEVAHLDYALNALGYSSSLGRLVGLTSQGHRSWKNPSHVVLVDTKGAVDDLGPVGAHWFRTDDVSAGTVVGTTFYVRDHAKLHAIDIDPASPTYLTITRTVVLGWPALTLDDFAPDPAGKLTGVSAAGHGPGEVVSFDPANGRVVSRTEIAGLPGKSTYGAVVIDSAGTVYAVNNGYKGRSRLYRISGGVAVELSSGPSMAMIDAAGCLPAPMPPRVQPPSPRPEVPAPAPPSPPAPAPVPAPAPAPAPVVPPPPAAMAKPAPAPVAVQPVPVHAARQKPEPRRDLPLDPETTPMTKSRKWAMVTIVLVMLGAGAAAARARG
ncbi:hypothetical protein [Lentzea sp. CC55]|uniref:DUF6923 family protein n=1 Tax=Lentzea sp. CC55 TaxID=2884909 RepID=UPI0035B2A6A4